MILDTCKYMRYMVLHRRDATASRILERSIGALIINFVDSQCFSIGLSLTHSDDPCAVPYLKNKILMKFWIFTFLDPKSTDSQISCENASPRSIWEPTYRSEPINIIMLNIVNYLSLYKWSHNGLLTPIFCQRYYPHHTRPRHSKVTPPEPTKFRIC